MGLPIGTGRDTDGNFTEQSDGWYRAQEVSKRVKAEDSSARLHLALVRTGQTLAPEPPRRRLSFEEQLALVASGRARIVDMDNPRA